MVGRTLALIAIATGYLLCAEDEPGQNLRVTKTERIDFPAGGVLHMKHSIGEVKIEGWDEPAMELTTTKSPPLRYDSHWNERAYHQRELEETRVAAERQENEIVITTTLPHRRSFPPPSPLRGSPGIEMDYRIRVPRDARLIIEHEEGEVHVENLTGDIRVTTIRGEIALRLPQEGQYAIDAKSDFGNVISDFPGRERRRLWLFGHRFVPDESVTGPKLYLRSGVGDVIIQKIHPPSPPAPIAHQ
jgi:hypothetical protein